MADVDRFEPFLAARVREHLEATYYARINDEARLERVLLRPDAWEGCTPNFLMPDHGVVHVRDVAGQVLDVLDLAHGVIIPLRDEERIAFMRALGVALAYLHDIGMVDASPRGRREHPAFAARALFTRAFDPLVAAVWHEDRGGVASRLAALVAAGAAAGPGERVLREVLSLSVAHSKRAIPIEVLNDPVALRRMMVACLGAPLPSDSGTASSGPPAPPRSPHDEAFDAGAFAWLVAATAGACDLVHDVVDTLRVLRCADALRQRGLVHKTSGGYEVFVNRQTGRAVHALRRTDEELYLLEWDDEHSSGEANVAASSLTPAGNLRVAFHGGAFGSVEALDRAVSAATFVVHDMMGDVLESFLLPASGPLAATVGMRSVVGGRVELECPADAPEFSLKVRDRLDLVEPGVSDRIDVIASLDGAPDQECDPYLRAPATTADGVETDVILRRLAAAGFNGHGIDVVAAFAEARIVTLERHEVLMRAGTLAAFVYVPLDDGLEVRPLGGYRSFPARAFMPLGSTGVIRGGARNADVVAVEAVRVLVIPRLEYLTHWYRPYSLQEVRERLLAQPMGDRKESPP